MDPDLLVIRKGNRRSTFTGGEKQGSIFPNQGEKDSKWSKKKLGRIQGNRMEKN